VTEQQPGGQPAAPYGEHQGQPVDPRSFPPPQVYGQPAPRAPDPYAPPAPASLPTTPPPPYGQPAAYPGYGPPPPYGGYPQPAGFGTPAYGGYPQPAPTPGASIALVVVSGFFVICGLIGVPSLVIGIVALTRARTEPDEARRLTWIGWLVLGILLALVVVIVVIAIAVAVSTSSSDDGSTIGTLGTTLRPLALRST
jgi:hypothetical protein